MKVDLNLEAIFDMIANLPNTPAAATAAGRSTRHGNTNISRLVLSPQSGLILLDLADYCRFLQTLSNPCMCNNPNFSDSCKLAILAPFFSCVTLLHIKLASIIPRRFVFYEVI